VAKVYYSDAASANILSLASQIDAGADITYDKSNDCFVMIPANGVSTYYFRRKNVTGIEGRFYVCDTRTMNNKEAASVETVEDNLKCFTKREMDQARKAMEHLVRVPISFQVIRTASSATRVSRCTEDDWEKLTRLLRYVNSDAKRKIIMRFKLIFMPCLY
jgi:hypothetical protein